MTDAGADFRTFTRQIHLLGTLRADTALRVGAGRSYEVLGDDLMVVKDTLERPVIPGSSLKGALRAHAERLLRTLESMTGTANLACDPLVDPCLSNDKVTEIKTHSRPDRELRQRACWACRLFGAPWLASKVFFRDLPVYADTWFEQFDHRDGVSIARDKGTAQAKRRYTLETVPAGTTFEFALIVDGATDAELGLLLLALEGLNSGLIQLGGARSRGLGDVSLQMHWGEVKEVVPPQALIALGERALGQALPTTAWSGTQRDAWIADFFQAIGLAEDEIARWQADRHEMEDAHDE